MKEKIKEKSNKAKLCLRCKKNVAKIGNYCERCNASIVERRIKRNIRKKKVFDNKNKEIICVGEKTKMLLDRFSFNLIKSGFKVKFKKSIQETPKQTIVLTSNNQKDIALIIILDSLFENNKSRKYLKKLKLMKQTIPLLYNISKKEFESYLKYKHIKSIKDEKYLEILLNKFYSNKKINIAKEVVSVLSSNKDFLNNVERTFEKYTNYNVF